MQRPLPIGVDGLGVGGGWGGGFGEGVGPKGWAVFFLLVGGRWVGGELEGLVGLGAASLTDSTAPFPKPKSKTPFPFVSCRFQVGLVSRL